jgi:hypothetical protein
MCNNFFRLCCDLKENGDLDLCTETLFRAKRVLNDQCLCVALIKGLVVSLHNADILWESYVVCCVLLRDGKQK